MNKTQAKKFMTSKLWISAVGFVIAAGYIMNCVIEPSCQGAVRLIDWKDLNQSLLILLAISGTRDITLEGIKLIGGRISIKNITECEDPDCQPFRKAVKRYWIPVVGWALAGGYFMNCVMWPLIPTITVVEWDNLAIALLTLLAISGGRDISLSGVKLLGGKISIQTPKCEHQTTSETVSDEPEAETDENDEDTDPEKPENGD